MNTVTQSPMSDVRNWFRAHGPSRFRGPSRASHVRVEDYVEDDTYVLRAELPGVDPERDVSVTMRGDTLTIDGERREETRTKQRREFYYGAFRRTLTLPTGTNAEDIEAAYTDGVLEVRIPLRTAGSPTPRRIPVTG